MFVLVEWAQASSLLTFTCSLVLVVLYLYGTYAYIGFLFRMQVCTYILYATSRWEFLVFCYFLRYRELGSIPTPWEGPIYNTEEYQPYAKAQFMLWNSQWTSTVKVWLNNKLKFIMCILQEVSWADLLITILLKEEDLFISLVLNE